MNERIRLLAEQAGFENGHQDRDGRSLSDELEKFAELIVQECISVVQKGGGMCGVISSNNLKQHFFGVEE